MCTQVPTHRWNEAKVTECSAAGRHGRNWTAQGQATFQVEGSAARTAAPHAPFPPFPEPAGQIFSRFGGQNLGRTVWEGGRGEGGRPLDLECGRLFKWRILRVLIGRPFAKRGLPPVILGVVSRFVTSTQRLQYVCFMKTYLGMIWKTSPSQPPCRNLFFWGGGHSGTEPGRC